MSSGILLCNGSNRINLKDNYTSNDLQSIIEIMQVPFTFSAIP